MISKRDIYLSGPLFTPAERAYLEKIDKICQFLGLSTYLPHRDAGFRPAVGASAKKFFTKDLEMLNHSKHVVAVLNGPDVDSGTAWEIGYAYACKKTLLGIREDIRIGDLNIMIDCSIKVVKSFSELERQLKELASSCSSSGKLKDNL
ncbi:MAG: nucleoside 2-deoxyribosyltransferase [Candidatus Hodarchaeota archaeon]